MTALNKLSAKVTEAINLDREIAEKSERLKEIKAELIKAADSDLMEKTDTDGGGWSVELSGLDGAIARVTQPGQKLKSVIDSESATWAKIKEIVGGAANRLFTPTIKQAPMEKFREILAAEFDKAEEKKILKLVTSNSSPTVSFETKEAA